MLHDLDLCGHYYRYLISSLWGLFRATTIAKPLQEALRASTDVFLLFHAKLSAFEFFQRLKTVLERLGRTWRRYESAEPCTSYGNEREAA
jgi:hypothetical protein